MVTEEWNNETPPEDDPEVMYEYTEEYAEMRKLQDEPLGY
jgi:hypothetical protein